MSPISHGVMYSSAQAGISRTFTLNILYTAQGTSRFVHLLDVLHHYLSDSGRSNVKILVYTTNDGTRIRNSSFVQQVVDLIPQNKDAVEAYIRENDIDIVHDPGQLFTKRDRFRLKDRFAFTNSDGDLTLQIESYLTGNSAPWVFREPIWHNNWLYKYTHEEGLAKKAFAFIATGQAKRYSQKQMELVRALANKTLHVEHAREQLYYYLQLKRRAVRMNNTANNFSFELTYHLTTYSFFVCSTVDITARLLNSLYDLRYTRFEPYGIEKADFIQRLKPKRKTLADIYARKSFQKWIEWMKVRRNHLAHESNLYLTPLMQQRSDPLTDAELEQKVDEAFDWQEYAGAGIDATGLRAMVKQQLDLELNYIEVVADMMTLEKVDRATQQAKTYIVFPLRTIDDDYKKLDDVISRTISNLSGARPQRSTNNP